MSASYSTFAMSFVSLGWSGSGGLGADRAEAAVLQGLLAPGEGDRARPGHLDHAERTEELVQGLDLVRGPRRLDRQRVVRDVEDPRAEDLSDLDHASAVA